MHSFIQRNKKRLLAVFGVLLMIVFVLPFGVGQFGQPDPTTLAYGKVGDETLTRADVARAGQDLDALRRAGFVPLQQLAEPPQPFMMGMPQGRAAAMLMESPETYALLQREARAAGVAPGEEEVGALYAQYFARVPNKTAEEAEAYRGAIERFLLVRDHFLRVTADLKVTLPLVRNVLATQQEARLNVVEFAAEALLGQVPDPTPEQVVAHYNQYAAVAPPPPPTMGMPATQPVQFGYQRPDRVKLQYLELPQERVVEAVVKGLGREELLQLDRIGYVHYEANPQDFQAAPATAPATPATNPDTGPTTNPAGTQPTTFPATAPDTVPAQPTTRPFDEATRIEIRRKLLTGAIQPPAGAFPEDLNALRAIRAKLDARADELRNTLRDRLLADFQAFSGRGGDPASAAAAGPSAAGPSATQPSGPATASAANASTAPTTAPTAVAVDKLEYLEAVADAFEKTHGVRPMVTSLANEWLTREALNALPGIGTSFATQGTFPELATRHRVEVEPEAPPPPTPAAPPSASPSAAGASATNPTTGPAAASATQPTTDPAVAGAATQPAVQPTKPAKPAMALYEPSPLLRDPNGNTYVFRLTAFEGRHVPPLEQVREQIVKDLKLTAAYAEARKQAEQARAAAGSSTAATGGLPTAAETLGQKLIVAGPINPQTMEVPGYDLSGDPMAQQTFLMSVVGLLSRATADQPHPATTVELPAQRKVLAVELRSLERAWTAAEDPARQARSLDSARIQLFRDRAIDIALLNWFNPETVAKRTNFTKAERG